jgi:hypothetical protein
MLKRARAEGLELRLGVRGRPGQYGYMCVKPDSPTSHKQRFQMLIESEQIAALRRIEERTGAPAAAQP